MNGALHVLVDEAIKRAIGFLLYSRDLRGLWSDFRLPVGESSGWVTGFVGSVLAGTGDDRVIGETRDVWNAFAAQKLFTGHGGWGYNLLTPEDADSTVWGIRFALSLGLEAKFRTKAAVPPPFMKIPVDPGNWNKGKGSAWGTVLTDHRSLFTTAAALDSLLCYQKTYHGTIKPEAL